MRVHFLTTAGRHVASARFRAWWIAEAWGSPEVTCGPADHPAMATADIVVISSLIGHTPPTFQTAAPVIWDLTDPIWCYMGDTAFLALARRMAHLTVSSDGLRDVLRTEFGLKATVIPDRLPYQATRCGYPEPEAPTLIWFGYGFNRWPAFVGASPLLARLLRNGVRFRLQIVDDQPQLPLYERDRYGLAAITEHLLWSEETMHARLCAADVAFLPPFPGWVGRMKSHNRRLTAAWAGLPNVSGDQYDMLAGYLTNPAVRRADGLRNRAWAEMDGDIQTSVTDWQALLARVTASELCQ